ncbi:hypothetical protein ABZ599_37200 [Streptomyces misionensis]|uniref:hypothetical protein n=1 Tax=Streptomyces misionensis TaxID=67331 RepID=UPI00340DE7E6
MTDPAGYDIAGATGVGFGKTVEMGTLLRIKLLAVRRRQQIKQERQHAEIERRVCLRMSRQDVIARRPDPFPPTFWEPPRLTVNLSRGDPPLLSWSDDERPRDALLDALSLEDAFLLLVWVIADAILTRALCGRRYEFLDAVPPVASSPCGVLRLRTAHVPRAPGVSGHAWQLSAAGVLAG